MATKVKQGDQKLGASAEVGKPLTLTVDDPPRKPDSYDTDLEGNEDVEKMPLDKLREESVQIAKEIRDLEARRRVVKHQISLLHSSEQMEQIARRMSPEQRKALTDRIKKEDK